MRTTSCAHFVNELIADKNKTNTKNTELKSIKMMTVHRARATGREAVSIFMKIRANEPVIVRSKLPSASWRAAFQVRRQTPLGSAPDRTSFLRSQNDQAAERKPGACPSERIMASCLSSSAPDTSGFYFHPDPPRRSRGRMPGSSKNT